MNEAPSNLWPVNQAALKWLQQVNPDPSANVSYLAQLAVWGIEDGGISVRPKLPSHPDQDEMEQALWTAYRWKAESASDWFLSNENLEREEQENNFLWQLEQAETPQDAASAVIEAAYDVMVAAT